MSLDLSTWWTLPAILADNGTPAELYQPHHVGLYLDRCLPEAPNSGRKTKSEEEQFKAKVHRRTLYESAINSLRMDSNSPALRNYRACYARWLNALSQEQPLRAVRVVELRATARLLLHPSPNKSVTDGSVLMHHTYGVPYLPGSGLKGMARAFGRRDTNEAVLHALFGNPRRESAEQTNRSTNDDQAALVNILDALWIPERPPGEPGSWSPLCLDVVTPHHSGYYTGNLPPGDWEQPVPTQRLAVSPGASFRVILDSPLAPKEQMDEWLDKAVEVLVQGAATLGFGAYTAAGFGRMDQIGSRQESSRTTPIAAATPTRRWLAGTVSLNKSSGELVAVLDNEALRARAQGKQARDLRESLGEAASARLGKQGSLRMFVEVEPLGTSLIIVGLRIS